MPQKLHNALFMITLGLIGADRIDLFGGHGPFRLTPFLFFCSLFILVSFLRSYASGVANVPVTPAVSRQKPFAVLVLVAAGLMTVSILFGVDPIHGYVQAADLAVTILFTFFMGINILNSVNPDKLIIRSVLFAIVVHIIFCVAQYHLYQFSLANDVLDAEVPHGFIYLTTGAFGPWLPRLCGATIDPNRAGFIFVMYLALIDLFTASGPKLRWVRILIHVIVLVTISNTAALSLLLYDVFRWNLKKISVTPRRLLTALAGALALLTLLFLLQGRIEAYSKDWNVSDILLAKGNVSSGSSGAIHVKLLERSVDVWLGSLKTFFFGIGMGADYTVLYDIFGSNRTANFHTLYGMFLADFGLPSFLLLMGMLIPPIFSRRNSRGCMLAIIAFNITYLTLIEPVFWLMLWMVWSLEYSSSRRRLSSGESLPGIYAVSTT